MLNMLVFAQKVSSVSVACTDSISGEGGTFYQLLLGSSSCTRLTTSCRLFALTTCSGKPYGGGGEGLSSSFIRATSTSVPVVLKEGMKCQSASVNVGQAVEDDEPSLPGVK